MKKSYQIKVQLKDFHPLTHRTLLVDPEVTFDVLHRYIQQLFGFEDYHMYSFFVGKDFEIVMSEEDKYNPEDKLVKETQLKDILKQEKDKVLYTYDFGDNWEFDITLQKIVETDETLPKVLKGKGGFLLEDSGGPRGLEDLIEIYNKKDKEEAENLGYDDFEMLEEELKETVLKEVDREGFELRDER